MLQSIKFNRKTKASLTVYSSVVIILSSVVFSQAQTYKFDFGVVSVAAVTGYTKVTTANLYTTTYANDNTNGVFGFENWDSLHLRGLNRVNPTGLNRDVIVGWKGANDSGFCSYYFSVRVPEGIYSVTFYIGDYGDTATTTIKAESRRLLVENLHTTAGQIVTRTCTVMRRDSSIAGSTSKVALDVSYGREYPPICLSWDHKLTFEFSGARPCIGGIDIVKVDDTTGITLHLCGNSTVVEQEDEPWTAWGQMVTRFFNSSVIVNDLANSGQTSTGFISQNRLRKICSVMRPGDFLFFEFGHNDASGGMSQATFQANMKTYYDSAVAHSATMVFVTPVARQADIDSSTSISSFAQWMRNYAPTLSGSKLIDLNTATIHLNAALATAAYGSNRAQLYCRVTASSLWPDQPSTLTSENTHFCDYGGYELAKWITQTGMKAANLGLTSYLLDTMTFSTTSPDLKSAFKLPISLDTVFRHATPGATIRADSTFAVTVKVEGLDSKWMQAGSFSINPASCKIAYSIYAGGNAEVILYEFNGKIIAQKKNITAKSVGSFQWRELDGLPSGMYCILMKVNNRFIGKTRFCKL